MKILRTWFFACLAFGFYSLQTLVKESYEIVYENGTETDSLQYLACEKLSDVYRNITKIDLKTIREDLCTYLNSSSINNRWRKNDPKGFEELVLNRTLSGDYLIFNKMFCLNANRSELKKIGDFLKYRQSAYFATHKDTFNFIQMKDYNEIDQLTVVKSSYSNCEPRNARYYCLNECFKRHRLSKYYYESSEIGTILLVYSDRNQTIRENERNCSMKCKRENCKLVQLSLTDVGKEPKTGTFEAQFRLSGLEYWIQLVGLLGFFSGLCFNQLVTIAIDFAESKTERRKVKIFLFYLKLAIILLSLAFCGYLCTLKVLDYKEQANSPKETEKPTNLIQPKIIRLAICVNINKYVDYRHKTMSEIEKATDRALGDALKGIHLKYQDKLFRVDIPRSREVLFMHSDRCFILPISPAYQPALSNPKLQIKFKKVAGLYLLSKNLTKKNFKFSGEFAFTKTAVKRLRSNGKCVNYKEKYKNCTSRWNCVDWCIQRKFSEKHSKTTFGNDGYCPVIDRDWFSSTEWNTSQIMGIPFYDQYKLRIFKNISGECSKKILEDKKPCDEIKFEKTYGIPETDDLTKEIDLQFEFEQSVEESPSFYKLVLDLATIQGIFFGLTVFKLLKTINNFRSKLRPGNNKIAQLLIYLLCLLGGSYHTYRIFDVIISDELVSTRYFERAKEMRMVFCNKIDENLIDRNHKLTGSYLEELTIDMTLKSLFEDITYLSESNEWTPFNFSLAERFFYLDMKCFRIEIHHIHNRNQFLNSKENQVLMVNFTKALDREEKFIYFMSESKDTGEFSRIVRLRYRNRQALKYSISHLTSLYEYADRFSFIRKKFVPLKEDEHDIVLNKQMLELQENPHNLKTLYLPVKEEDLHIELQDDLFEQLDLAQNNQNKVADLNYKQLFVVNHLKSNNRFKQDFSFNLNPLQKITFSTNEDNFGKLIISLLNMLSVWLDLGVLDLHPIFVLSHDYLLVYLYCHLPIFLFTKFTQLLILSHNFLKKFESPLYKILKPRKQKSQNIPRPRSALF